MNRPGMAASGPASLVPEEGWHCRHWYYRWNRAVLAQLDADHRAAGREQFLELFGGAGRGPERLQLFRVPGHKADFGVMALDPDPLVIDGLHQQLISGLLGAALETMYSFVSLTEVSEYVPTVEQYAARLVAEGEQEGSPAYEAKVKAYAAREPKMREQRLRPQFPDWPAMCFYPMNKKRKVSENWFTLPFSARNKLMAEHARSGMEFAGKVTQLITVSVGLDDWEWGVTLWARNPQFLKDIVYRMRFDEASARYAEFGPFYTGFVGTAEEILDYCQIC